MKKSYFARLICLVLAGLALCSAIATAAISGSPYETLKRSLFDLVSEENLTVKTEFKMYLDGELDSEDSSLTMDGDKSYLSVSGNDYLSYHSEAFTMTSWHGYDDGEVWYSAQAPGYQRYGRGIFGSAFPSETYSRFAELVLDLAVGDLKNNISMSQNGDVRNISGTLTDSQIPELYNAAFELILTQNGLSNYHISDGEEVVSFDLANGICVTRSVTLSGLEKETLYSEYNVEEVEDINTEGYSIEYGGKYYLYTDHNHLRTETEPATREDYANLPEHYRYSGALGLAMSPLTSGKITYVHGDASVDSEGRLMGINGTVSADVTDIFGDKHVVELVFDIEVSDIGTTSPECPVEGVEELLASYAHEDAKYSSVRFKVAPDGTIDTASVFDDMSDVYK